MAEFPDWLRAVALVGKSGLNYVPVAVDANGNMYILMQGTDGATLRPVLLDSAGRIVGTLIDPASGNYVAVDSGGRMSAVIKGQPPVGGPVSVAVDAWGQIIMVPKGASGNYVQVNPDGYMSALIKASKGGGNYGDVAIDASGQLIMVPRGSNGNYMTVDASGFLTTVMKGLYAGALGTIAIDSAGRMVGIIADPNGNFGQVDTIGLAELAGRLGGLQRWDTRGKFMCGESFDGGIISKINLSITGAATCTSNPEKFESGGYSARVYLTAGATDDAQINLWIAPGQSSKIGIETAFSFDAIPFYIYCMAQWWQSSVLHVAGLKWDVRNNKLYYYNSSAVWTEITGVTIPTPVDLAFNHMKCVVDFGSHLYMRALANGLEVDLSSHAIYTVASGAGDIIQASVKVGHVLNQITTVWIDNIVVTYSEPAN